MNRNCLICSRPQSDEHHITSRGAGGGEEPSNKVYLCRQHHQELHYSGLSKFMSKYVSFLGYLKEHSRDDVIEKANKLGNKFT
jgi:hypothetical protein